MKKQLLLSMLLLSMIAVSGYAATIPFYDAFGASGPAADWETDSVGTAFAGNGTLTTTAAEADWRGVTVTPPAGGDGYMGKLAFAASGYATSWRVLGAGTEKNYTLRCKMFVPVIDTVAEPDDYLYQQLIFASNTSGYGRMHFQLNLKNADLGLTAPRIRIQVSHSGALVTKLALYSPTNFTVEERWWDVMLVVNNTGGTAELFLDGVSKGVATIAETAFADGGKFGIAEYVDGDCAGVARSAYFDQFRASDNASVQDWTSFE